MSGVLDRLEDFVADNPDREVAEPNTILRAVVGSTLHGLALEGTDDRDEMGVCIEPAEYVIGLRRFEQWVHRTKPEGVRSGPGDLDLTVYSLRKYLYLAAKGNPTVILLLFAPPDSCTVRTRAGERLQLMAPYVIARDAGRAYLGYMRAQRERLLGLRGQKRVKRPDLEETHGYDTKYAMHMLRLGCQGMELLSTGRLSLPMREHERADLMAVRRGEVPRSSVLLLAEAMERKIEDLLRYSRLQERPDRERIDRFLIDEYQHRWDLPLDEWESEIGGVEEQGRELVRASLGPAPRRSAAGRGDAGVDG